MWIPKSWYKIERLELSMGSYEFSFIMKTQSRQEKYFLGENTGAGQSLSHHPGCMAGLIMGFRKVIQWLFSKIGNDTTLTGVQ